MPDTSATIVCLPQDTPADQLTATADARLAATPRTNLGPTRHFTTATRLRRARLLQPCKGSAAGGPVRLLDLDAMRAAARRRYWYRWIIWNQVVAGTKPARPYWTFLDRHQANPDRYPLATAQRHYLAQPRIAAMQIYNALPNKIMALPTRDLEALQTGPHGYAHLGWLCAAPGEGLVGLDGTYLTVHSDHLGARLAYLAEANRRIDALQPDDFLVALTTR